MLIATGALMLTVVLWSEAESALYQIVQNHRFEARVRQSAAVESALPDSPLSPASPQPTVHPSAEVLDTPSPQTRQLPRQWSLIADLGALDPLLIGRLEIPRLGLSAMVREGVEPSTLRRAVGHVPGTALPGQRGNFVVAGHRDSFFRDLRLIRNNDEIRLRIPGGVFTYHVTALSVVDPNDTQALQVTTAPVCTLVTCFPFDYFGPAPRRFIVRAEID
jgi:LPXTG-site transpeptidase (sortase) family protein